MRLGHSKQWGIWRKANQLDTRGAREGFVSMSEGHLSTGFCISTPSAKTTYAYRIVFFVNYFFFFSPDILW